MIVGEVEVTGTVVGSPEEVWQQTAELSGISKEFFDTYYAGKENAIARFGADPAFIGDQNE